jgi:SAM-dependent methyltransferase
MIGPHAAVWTRLMAQERARDLLEAIDKYYSETLRRHGTTARGVDWNSAESQQLRFEQLCRVFRGRGPFSVNDLGCGYGELVSFLEQRGLEVDYLGIDISQAMIEAAQARVGGRELTRFLCARVPDRVADYGLASGIFNVRAGASDADWHGHLLATLDAIDAHSARGFAFNALPPCSDPGRWRRDLYYCDPLALVEHCRRSYAREVTLLDDYGLHEFTIIVRKEV